MYGKNLVGLDAQGPHGAKDEEVVMGQWAAGRGERKSILWYSKFGPKSICA